MKRVLLTGAAGGIGSALREHAKGRYHFRCFDRVPVPGESDGVVGNLTDLKALAKACDGCDAVVHLGAQRDEADFMTTILPDNILGTYNAYEAARLAGVKRFVFMSSAQTEEGYPEGTFVTPSMLPRSLNTYAVSKVLGEHLGQVYAYRHGLSVICLRAGWVALPREYEEIQADDENVQIVCTIRDCCEILCRAVDAEGVDYAVLPAMSRNAAKIRDLQLLEKVLRYVPQDDAYELFRMK